MYVLLRVLQDEDRFLMASKKRSKQKTSNYIISRNEKNLDRNSEYYMGKLRSNFVGTEFLVFDDGTCDVIPPS